MNTFIEEFIAFLQAQERSKYTIKNYACDLNAFAIWFEAENQEELAPTRVTPIDMREYKQEMLKRELKPASINRKLACIKSFLNHSSIYIQLPKHVKQMPNAPRALSKQQQFALIRSAERFGTTRDIALIKLMLGTGLRVGEVCALRWKDVQITERKGSVTIISGKGAKRRDVPLNKEVRNALSALTIRENNDYIFEGQRGELTPRGVQFMMSNLCMKHPLLTSVTVHQLRHTFCKSLIDSDVGLQIVAALAGHESLESTRRYIEPNLKDLTDAVDKLSLE